MKPPPEGVSLIRVALSESKGPIPSGIHVMDDGRALEVQGRGTPCPGCGEIPKAGDHITKIFFSWWHDLCGAAHLRDMGADAAWVALGQQLERSPSKFTNPETKAIVRNLLRLIGASVYLPEPPAPTTQRDVRAPLRAVPNPDFPF
jgi:hypothetical protein